MGEIRIVDETHRIFFSRDNVFPLPFKFIETPHNGIQVTAGEIVMVGKQLDLHLRRKMLQMPDKGFGVSNTRQHQQCIICREPFQPRNFNRRVRKKRMQRAITEPGEEQFLEREQFQIILENPVFQSLELLGTFGHHNHIGTVNSTHRFPQPTERQQFVEKHRIIELRQHNRNGGLDIPMLESIVEHYEVYAGVKAKHLVNPCTTVLTYSHSHVIAEFLINLVWFITYIKGGRPTWVARTKPLVLRL